jgi:hypothetical protein
MVATMFGLPFEAAVTGCASGVVRKRIADRDERWLAIGRRSGVKGSSPAGRVAGVVRGGAVLGEPSGGEVDQGRMGSRCASASPTGLDRCKPVLAAKAPATASKSLSATQSSSHWRHWRSPSMVSGAPFLTWCLPGYSQRCSARCSAVIFVVPGAQQQHHGVEVVERAQG